VKAVIASRNRHKIEQIRRLLPGLELVPVDDIAPALELAEPYDTYRDNALAKARAVVNATGLPAIADDSGLEVDALGGRPGVLSARYAGLDATDAENNRKLVEELAGTSAETRGARYRCVAVFLAEDGTEMVASGEVEGRIVLDPRGALGFGYDPHFVPVGESRTMGEIPVEEKLHFSHRGKAFRSLGAKLRQRA
jgi:XTP/dITP diphosphohydrolase